MDEIAIHTLLRASAETELGSVDEADERSNEQKLIDALDLAALKFSKLMLDDRMTEDGTAYIISLDTRRDLFKMIREWVAVRRRTDIDDPADSQKGVQAMQREIANAKTATASAPEVEKRGRGRPSNVERAAREAKEAAEREEKVRASRSDDSVLRNSLARTGFNPNGAAS